MAYPAQQIRFCQSRDGTRIAFATSGTGPPLVRAAHLFNHLKLDWESPVWRPLLSVLARNHMLIRYDLRGAGLSDRDGVEISLDRHVEDLEAVVDAARVERFPLFAVSGGVSIAMRYAGRHPERVGRLILYAGATRGRLTRNPTREAIAEAEAQLKLIESGWSNENPAFRQLHTMQFMPDATPEQARAFTELMHQTASPAAAAALLRVFWSVDNREVATRIQCPTLVLHPRGDSRIPFEEGRTLAGLIPGARLVPLDSRNHLIVESEPAWGQFLEALDEFLATPLRPPGKGSLPVDNLTVRERQVLELLAQGLDNHTIGDRLSISGKTVRNQVSIIFSKLGVDSRGQAIVRARDAGFGRKTSQ